MMSLSVLTPRQFTLWKMKRSGLSISEIASRLGISRQAVHKGLQAVEAIGCWGVYVFRSIFRGIGRVWMYVTNRYNLVLITTKDDAKYVISPENPDEFILKLNSFSMNFRVKAL